MTPRPDERVSFRSRIQKLLFGAPRDIKDRRLFHRISLVALLAWVGLGADGLSSSAYGPEEAFRALGEHSYLALGLIIATTVTIFVITASYARIVEQFPSGGGGYVVAGKLLGPKFGVVSGSALLIDYILTISVSISAGADQLLSALPPEVRSLKLLGVGLVIILLMVMNIRGVKESITALLPIFWLFILTHLILIVGGVAVHVAELPTIVVGFRNEMTTSMETIGILGMGAILVRAYSMGAGTYTGIEAVSNGVLIMREPRVRTAKRTMLFMAVSLAFTAGGILLLYLLFRVTPVDGKTLNASLLERFTASWEFGGATLGHGFVVVTLAAEAALLFVAAQAGFIDGPRVMAMMAVDGWLPERLGSLSNRLTMAQGVALISAAALLTLMMTGGDTRTLVLMYSINVFVTFSLSQLGMVKHWVERRVEDPGWLRRMVLPAVGLALCVTILVITVYEKFEAGGWITVLVTAGLVVVCFAIKRQYEWATAGIRKLDEILRDLPMAHGTPAPSFDASSPIAVLLVEEFSGPGIHSLFSILRLFPKHFKNVIFVSVTVLDAGNFKGIKDVDAAKRQTKKAVNDYVDLARQLGLAAESRTAMGPEMFKEAVTMCKEIAKEFPRAVFFTSKLVFERQRWYHRLLYNETAFQIQREMQFAGLNTMVLPVRVFDSKRSGRG
jgi:amino acid transporter